MRVAHYCQTFSHLSETAIYTWTTELQRQGVDGHVVAHERQNEASRPFPSVLIVPRPRTTDPDRVFWRVAESFGKTEDPTSWYTTLRKRLARTFRDVAPDVVHAHFGNDAWVAAPPARAVGAPLIVTFHGYDISELMLEKTWRDRYREDLWPAAAFVTVLSEEMREAVEEHGCPPDKVRIVRVGRPIAEMPSRSAEPAGLFTLVSIGRLSAKKGHEDAIRAVARLHDEGRTLRLRIFGGGELEEPLRTLIDTLGVGEAVTLEGPQPNDVVLDALQAAHAFLLCSKTAPNGDREGTPNVFVEAQGLGLPCISTQHAGIPEMIPEAGQHLLASEGDVDGIADRIADVMEMTPEARLSLGARGRAKMQKEYDLATECRTFRHLYAEALAAVRS